VNYLYTDTYRTLRWVGPKTDRSCYEIAKLKTAFEVYVSARMYEIPGLEVLVKENIAQLTKGLDAFTVVDVVNEVYPLSTGDDTWFPAYMKGVERFTEGTELMGAAKVQLQSDLIR